MYDNFYWDELPPRVKEAAGALGYTDAIWDDDGEPDEVYWLWSELGADLQEAAGVLGHDLDSWNEHIYESTEPGEWSDYGFSELPIEIQEAAEELGYD